MDLASLSDDQLRQLVEMGELSEEDALLLKQRESANELRNRDHVAGPTYAGRMVFSNPLTTLGNAWRGRKAGQEIERIDDQLGRNREARVDGRVEFLNQVLGRTGPMSTRTMSEPTVAAPQLETQLPLQHQQALAASLRQRPPTPQAAPSAPASPQAPAAPQAPAPGPITAPPRYVRPSVRNMRRQGFDDVPALPGSW